MATDGCFKLEGKGMFTKQRINNYCHCSKEVIEKELYGFLADISDEKDFKLVSTIINQDSFVIS